MRRRTFSFASAFSFLVLAAVAGCDSAVQPILPGTAVASAGDQQTAVAGAAATVTATSGSGQSAPVATPVSIAPTVMVKDVRANPVANATVTFSVTSGGGSIIGETVMTDANGTARLTSWTLGSLAGTNTVSASVPGIAPAIILARGTPGAAFAISLARAPGPTQVASAVAPNPSVVVRDAFQNAIAGVAVTFTSAAGNGTVTGATKTTDSTGAATVGSWTLGTPAGAQILTASVNGIMPLTISTNALAGAAAAMNINGGNNQSGQTSTTLSTAPSVIVQDQFGNRVAGAAVSFVIVSGGGSLTGANTTTNSSGVAAVGSWTLGASAGSNTLSARTAGVNASTFTANATAAPVAPPPPVAPPSNPTAYNITVRYVVPPTVRQQQAVDKAVARWQQVIRGDLTDVPINSTAGQCGPNSPAINQTVDDILVLVDFSTIDGPGNILGQAGPCLIRSSNRLTIVGSLNLDAADLSGMESNGLIDDVVLHEIGHVLGIGSLWQDKGMLSFAQSDSVTFTGGLAGSAFSSMGGITFPGRPVPVENCVGISGCGDGTRDSHWRERVMGRELMTGYVSPPGTPNPLSRITIQSLADLGYTVDSNAADNYSVGLSLRTGPGARDVELNEAARNWPIRVVTDRQPRE